MEFGDELVQIAVDVADDVQRPGARGRGLLGDVLDLDGVTRPTAADDRQIAVGGGVALVELVLIGRSARGGRLARGRWRGHGRALPVVRGVLAVHGGFVGKPAGHAVRDGLGDRNSEVPQRLRPHRGSLTGPLSHRPLHHRRAAVHLRTLLTSGEEGP